MPVCWGQICRDSPIAKQEGGESWGCSATSCQREWTHKGSALTQTDSVVKPPIPGRPHPWGIHMRGSWGCVIIHQRPLKCPQVPIPEALRQSTAHDVKRCNWSSSLQKMVSSLPPSSCRGGTWSFPFGSYMVQNITDLFKFSASLSPFPGYSAPPDLFTGGARWATNQVLMILSRAPSSAQTRTSVCYQYSFG